MLSMLCNIYYFGSQKIKEEKEKIYNKGVSDGITYIYDFVEKNGFISIKKDEKELILTIKR